jgi:transposase-like protein
MAKTPLAKTGKTRTASALKRQRALELRLEGKTFTQIGEVMGCAKGTAYTWIKKELDELAAKRTELAESVRDLHSARCLEMLAGVYPAATGGDVQAIYAVLKLMEYDAKLYGLFAPTTAKYEHTGKIDVMELSDDELRERAADIIRRISDHTG